MTCHPRNELYFSSLCNEAENNLGIVMMWIITHRVRCCNVSGGPRQLLGVQTIQLCFTLFYMDIISPPAPLENHHYIRPTRAIFCSILSASITHFALFTSRSSPNLWQILSSILMGALNMNMEGLKLSAFLIEMIAYDRFDCDWLRAWTHFLHLYQLGSRWQVQGREEFWKKWELKMRIM